MWFRILQKVINHSTVLHSALHLYLFHCGHVLTCPVLFSLLFSANYAARTHNFGSLLRVWAQCTVLFSNMDPFKKFTGCGN